LATFGERLRYLHEEKGLKQTELAKMLNLESSSTISQYETINRIPDAYILQRLAEIFDCSIDYLLGRSNIRNGSISAALNKVHAAVSDDPELLAFWQELSEREDLQTLFRQTKDLSPEAIKRVIRYIKMVEDEEAAEEF